jgi:hypothetical protein
MRRLRNAINPFSTGFTRWWCHSDLRAVLGGKQRGAYKQRPPRILPMDETVRRHRIAEIERILADDEPAAPQP